jgi:hypothetical protein
MIPQMIASRFRAICLFTADQQQAKGYHHQPEFITDNGRYGYPPYLHHHCQKNKNYCNGFQDRPGSVTHNRWFKVWVLNLHFKPLTAKAPSRKGGAKKNTL